MNIDKHDWFDNDISHSHNSNSEVFIDVEYDQWGGHLNGFSKEDKTVMINKSDVIALAKHFNLTAHDIDCSEFKALQTDADATDEAHFDEIVQIQADKIKINKRVN